MNYPLLKLSSSLFLSYLLVCLLNGCSTISIPSYNPNTKSIKILAAKRFLKGADYERLSYAEGEVKRECGEVKKDLLPIDHDILTLSDQQKRELDRLVDLLLASRNDFKPTKSRSLNDVQNEGLSGKGYLVIEIEKNDSLSPTTIPTELLKVTESEEESYLTVREIYHILRASCDQSYKLCGYPSFYGLGRGSLDSGLGCKVTRQ
jgi:hypothetical protein